MTLTSGVHLGRYEIRSKIGEGGMGEVYLAQDTQLRRSVALKILPAEFTQSEERLRRFQQEAYAASALNHPNIITIHEIGKTDSAHYIVTEFIDGESLRQLMQRGPVSVGKVLDVAVQITSALATAHAAGITHRDIKPENVMLRRDGVIKVLDFGLAKLTQNETAVDSEALTRALVNTGAGMVMGTASYMSPEQARGTDTDARTDIFSLGVVLYEMLAGRAPFTGETTADIISMLLQKEPQPLSTLAHDVPAELQHIVSKALRKDRDERYQTVKSLLVDLKTLQQELDFAAKLERGTAPDSKDAAARNSTQAANAAMGNAQTQTAAARPTSSAEYVVSRIKQHRRGFAAGLAVLLLVVIGFGYWLYNHRASKPAQIESVAVLPFVNASGNADVEYLSDGITESLINSLSQLPHLSVKARSAVFRYKGKQIEPQQVASELSVQAILNGRVVLRGDDLTLYLSLVDARTGNQLWGEQYNRKMSDLISLQSEIARDVSRELRARLSGADAQKLTKNYPQNAEAYRAYLKGLYYWNKGLAPGYEKSRDLFQQAIDLDPSYALAYSGLALYYSFAAANGLLSPDENSPKAEAAANKALALDETLAESYNPLAAVKLYYYRDWPAAERYFRRGIEVDPNFAEIHNHYALCLYLFGRNEEALTEIQRAVELEPLSLRFTLSRARILFFIRQYDRAIDQFRKTLELEPNFALAHEWLGDAYEQKGMHREAIAEWGKALTLSGEGEQASLLERTYAASGFETAVRALAQKKLERLNEKTGRGEYVPAAEYVMAYQRLGDKEKVFGWLAKAVEERNRFALEFKVNPIFDSLRGDPRFQDLLRRVGL
jgi:serine/threonine protein kinase/tetratricopeptide (TPR) repeat protein